MSAKHTPKTIARVTAALRIEWAVDADAAYSLQGSELVQRTPLVDASQELLEALRNITAAYERVLSDSLPDKKAHLVDQSPTLIDARAAIAKATGGSA